MAVPPGDLYVEIIEVPHPHFTRDGDDLHCTVQLPMTAAALGTTLELDTLDGGHTMPVKPGTQSGTAIRVPARGVQHLRGTGRGDLIVHLEVQTPSKLDARQEALLRELATLRGEESAGRHDALRADRPLGRAVRAVLPVAQLRPLSFPVTAPLFLVEPGALDAAGPVLLAGPEGRHAAKVRRLGVGERVDLADGTGVLSECVVASAAGESLTLDVVRRLELPVPSPRFTVVQALPKGDRGELAVEVMTEVGVDAVVPWAASRCVTQWVGARGERSAARWAAHAREASKQARRARVPVVAPLASTRDVCVVIAVGGAGPRAARVGGRATGRARRAGRGRDCPRRRPGGRAGRSRARRLRRRRRARFAAGTRGPADLDRGGGGARGAARPDLALGMTALRHSP